MSLSCRRGLRFGVDRAAEYRIASLARDAFDRFGLFLPGFREALLTPGRNGTSRRRPQFQSFARRLTATGRRGDGVRRRLSWQLWPICSLERAPAISYPPPMRLITRLGTYLTA